MLTHANSNTPADTRLASAIGLFKALPEAVIVTDQTGLIIDLNPAAENFYSCTLHDVKNKSVSALLEIDELSDASDTTTVFSTNASSWNTIATARIRNCAHCVIDVNVISVASDQAGHRALKFLISRPDQQPRTEQRGKVSDSHFRRIANAAPILVWQAGPDAQCNYFNRPWQEFTGRYFVQGTWQNWGEGVHQDDLDHCIKMYTEAFAAREPFQMDYRLKRHDGVYRWVLDYGGPRYAADGSFEGFSGTCVDITERKDLEEALRACTEELELASRRKDEFLSMLSHELRNPLAPIANSVAVIRTLEIADPLMQKSCAVIERQVEHLRQLVNDLLDVAHVTRGKKNINMEALSIDSIVERAMEISRPKMSMMAHAVEVTRPAHPLYIKGDLTGLAQALSNILNNAAKFTPSPGRITVIAGQRNTHAFITVRDNGVGISKNFQPRLFALFAQADDSLARTQSGLGIGLAIAHEILSLHGGTIEAHSEGIGFGSEFTIFLPLHPDQSLHDEKKVDVVNAVPANRGFRILLIDDNQDAIESMETLLKLLHYDVRIANDAEAGLAAATEFMPHLVLSDIGLPDMSGYQLAPALRKTAGARKMVLAAATGYGLARDRARSQAAGFDFHLVKPIDADFLLEFVAQQAATY